MFLHEHCPELGGVIVHILEHPQHRLALGQGEPDNLRLQVVGVLEAFGCGVEAGVAESASASTARRVLSISQTRPMSDHMERGEMHRPDPLWAQNKASELATGLAEAEDLWLVARDEVWLSTWAELAGMSHSELESLAFCLLMQRALETRKTRQMLR